MSKQEELKQLPVPYTSIECLMYYIATGEIPDNLPDTSYNTMQEYLKFIAKYGISAQAKAGPQGKQGASVKELTININGNAVSGTAKLTDNKTINITGTYTAGA